MKIEANRPEGPPDLPGVDPANVDQDDRLSQAIGEFVAAIEAGRPADPSALLTKYSDVAEELVACIETFDFIQHVAPQLTERTDDDEGKTSTKLSPLATLGDFRILKELGRGGMGVVYEAEQLSIGRRVALKVLPFAALLDPQHLNRFKNEARAAGTLDHPNIVSVHSVGTERGVHYYAMQLVEGQSLAQVIREWQLPGGGGRLEEASSDSSAPPSEIDTAPVAALSTVPFLETQDRFRSVARLGVQAAQALDHAHQNGIVHRDVKPANLLVNSEGKLWVTDFGLARIESDASFTMTGDILGTLRYMSPEQAQGTRAVVDHRTDIYSLGATLYELLALQPTFQSENRQELFRKIAQDQPISLGKINPSIPRDLVTIVGKAMEKRPEDRYRTAQELADDLTCFLQDRPIQAKPPTPAARVMKWSRRHVKIVWAALAASLLIAALLAGGTVLIARSSQEAHRQREVAIDEKQEAQRNLYRANVQIAHYEWDDGRVDRTLDLLDAVRPSRGETDYRCWEWYYVKSLCHRGESIDGDLVDSAPSCPLQLVCRVNGETYTFVDRESGDVRLVVAGREELGKLRLDPAGERIACAADRDLWRQLNVRVAEYSSIVLRVYDLATRSKLWERKLTPAVLNLDWSPNGGRIATVHRGGAVKVWDAADGSLAAEMKGYTHSSVKPPKWSPDGHWIAAGRRIWNAASGEQAPLRVTQSDEYMETDWDPYRTLDWDPSGRRIATTNVDQLGVWDLDSDEPLLRFRAHRGWVRSVAWSPDGKTIATAGNDSFVKVWDATNGKLLNVFRGHTDPVASVRWIDTIISMPSVADGKWQLLPIGVAFAAALTIIGAGISVAVAAWPRMAPRILFLNAGLTIMAVLVGPIFVTHTLGFVAVVCAACGGSMVVVLGVALAGLAYRICQTRRCS